MRQWHIQFNKNFIAYITQRSCLLLINNCFKLSMSPWLAKERGKMIEYMRKQEIYFVLKDKTATEN